jgi:hypothetical protein
VVQEVATESEAAPSSGDAAPGGAVGVAGATPATEADDSEKEEE